MREKKRKRRLKKKKRKRRLKKKKRRKKKTKGKKMHENEYDENHVKKIQRRKWRVETRLRNGLCGDQEKQNEGR